MKKLLLTWVGQHDHDAADGKPKNRGPNKGKPETGPIYGALTERSFDRCELLNNYTPASKGTAYVRWLKSKLPKQICDVAQVDLSSPNHYGEIWEASGAALRKAMKEYPDHEVTILLTPGTPVMHAVWLFLGTSHFDVRLARTSEYEPRFEFVDLPFDVYADFHPQKVRASDEALLESALAQAPRGATFDAILHKSAEMERLLARARVVALRHVPVLIQGESGTGKELIANAVHEESPRAKGPFRVVNCGAIPSNLVESELFGVKRGSFTGADKDKTGIIAEADGGTLFLDEIGEMPLDVQVKLLRVLQEREVKRVGDTRGRKVDFRVVAATNRNLLDEVAAGRFREDLFHRLAVGVLHIPPLRDRKGDAVFVANALLEQVNEEAAESPGYVSKKLSASARKVISAHPWPGNVRELKNTLLRASVWTQGEVITGPDMTDALLPTRTVEDSILGRPIERGIHLDDVLDEVDRHYLERAVSYTHGNKTKAAALLGFNNAQTLRNRMKSSGAKMPRI